MRKFPVAISLLALSLAACGGDDEPQQFAPPPVIEDPLAYFGMAPCSCFEYAPADEWAQGKETFSAKLGVAVERLGGERLLDRNYHLVRYRVVGTLNEVVREEYLDPTDPDLLVAGVNVTGRRNDPVLRLDPPASLVRGPAEEMELVRSKTDISERAPAAEEEPAESESTELIVQYRDEEGVEIGYWDAIEQSYLRETVRAIPISYRGVEGLRNDHVRWFVPGTGFVKLRMEHRGEKNEWVLINTRMLDPGSCDYDGGTSEPIDHCGT